MAKKVTGFLKLQVPAGAANPSPPIGPALGQRGLAIMDSTAVTLCMDNRMPIIVFDLFTEGNIERVILGEQIGTRVDAEGTPA